MTAVAETLSRPIRIARHEASKSILVTAGRADIAIRGGTVIEIDGRKVAFDSDTAIETDELKPGCDYAIDVDVSGAPFAAPAHPGVVASGAFAGFHFAPGGNALGKAGGDAVPAINPFSLWDLDFRPACKDPRGMTFVEMHGLRFWVDIYLLGTDHLAHGTSRCGAVIADGRDLPDHPDGSEKTKKLDYATAVEIYAAHGKRLLFAEEFFAAAYGVEERCSRDRDPKITGTLSDEGHRFISKHGLFDATGTVWQWGTDGHPDIPRPSIFGGSWVNGDYAGSRSASLDYWPGYSHGYIGARGACGHLSPA
jgi:hypothetical protein